MKTLWLAGIFLALAAAVSPAFSAEPTTRDQLVGTWRFVKLTATSGDKVTYQLGEHIDGYLTITSDRLWLLVFDATRKTPSSPALSDAEAVAMFKTQIAWTGKYELGDQTPEGVKLIAHVDAASSQAIFGAQRVYFVRVEGDKVFFKSPGVIIPNTGETSVVDFEMVKAN